MRSPRVAGFVVALIGATVVGAQAPAFEVASVKIAPPRTGTERMAGLQTDPAMVRYSNITLKSLIAMAYRFDSRLIQSGPPWLDDQLYDVAAKIPSGVPKDAVPVMLQALLAERFKLVVHREKKEDRAYFLVVGKGGPKLKNVVPPEVGAVQDVRGDRLPAQIWNGGISGRSIQMAVLAGLLSHATGYQVVDRTGLTGAYDVKLTWTPEGGPDVFAALQEQLGLKLETGKAVVETLVVERAERTPVEN